MIKYLGSWVKYANKRCINTNQAYYQPNQHTRFLKPPRFRGNQNHQQANTLHPRTILPEVGITTTAEYQQLAIFFFFGRRLWVPHRFRLRFTPPPYPYEGFFARLACLQGHGETNEARRKHCIPGTITEA